MSDATRILDALHPGDSRTAEALLPVVYQELRRLAAHQMAREAPGHTLQATALVHEAWLRLVGTTNQRWDDSAHFFGAAAEAMRRILIECARRKQRLKRGGGLKRIDLEDVELPLPLPDDELLALDAALDRLEAFNPRAAEMVKLCFFVGLTQAEAARQLKVSVSTAERLWAFARAWLFEAMHGQEPCGESPGGKGI